MKKIYLLLFNILLSFFVFAQETLTSESIYVHTDKNTYLPGEILWFKIYAVDTPSKKPSILSAVGYISISNAAGNEVLQAKVELNPESSNGGSIFIPQNLASGKYKLTAYTTLSETSNQTFSKTLNILNPFSINDTLASKPLEEAYASLFPEGGVLVNSLTSKVGFKIVDHYGKGTPGTLFVYSNDKLETSANSNALGMGNFTFTPSSTKKYTVKVKLKNGKELTAKFPEIQNKGYVLRVTPNAENYTVIVTAKDPSSKNVLLKVDAPGFKTETHALNLDANETATFDLNINQLPVGTSSITLSTENGVHVAERVVFRKPVQVLNITPTLAKNNLKNREQVELSLAQNSKTNADISISVFKIDDINPKTEEDILSYLYLQKDLSGNIENAKQYFSGNKTEEIDNLLLTQGWRKFKPQSLELEKRYHTLKIKFTNKGNGDPILNQEAMLSIPGKTPMVYTSVTDQEGLATFYVKNLYGSKQLATKLVNGASANIEIIRPDIRTSQELDSIDFSKISQNSYDEYAVNTQVENIFNGKNRSIFLAPTNLDSIPFFGKASAKYNLDDYTRFVLMEEVLREYIKELNVRKNKDNFAFRVLDNPRGVYFTNDPLVLLDGVPFISANDMINYDPLKIKSIEVIANKYFLGNGIYEGIVNFSTYKNALDDFTLDASYNIFSYEGLQLEREFYSPEINLDQRLPDNRSLLYWNPKVTLNSNTPNVLKFITSDLKGKFLIDIQGLNANGLAGANMLTFEID